MTKICGYFGWLAKFSANRLTMTSSGFEWHMVSLRKKQLLCSVLLLAGCQSDPGRLTTQSHTDDLINLYLSQAAVTIASMQSQLYPSPAKPIAQNRTSSLVIAHTGVASNLQVVGIAGATAIIAHDGKNQTLSTAIKDIIPGSWHYTLSPRISAKKKVSWTGNDQWPHVLDRLVKSYGWSALIDWNAHSVSISDVPIIVPATSAKDVPLTTTSVVQARIVQPVSSHPANPFSQSGLSSQKQTSLQPPAVPVVTSSFKPETK